MSQQLPLRFSLRRLIGAYVVAIIVGSLASAAVILLDWLRENSYDPESPYHLFVAKFFVPWLAAVSILLVGMAPILIPMYVACVIAVQKWAIRSRAAFMGCGVVFAAVAWSAFFAWHCLISTRCSVTPTSITHLPLVAVFELIAIGAASGMACRFVLMRRPAKPCDNFSRNEGR
ncbi:hypothetical protein [Paraburkholderia tropica]|uniref:hypothetical protein n=1 Tax=Paraburkholderia tropica TaxID=92647 RepID=UPI002ABE8936|nr:hypothetical protein [Paraburkholderia tropica]